MNKLPLLFIALVFSPLSQARISELYQTKLGLTENDLIVEVNGYKVPTRDAFEGWLLVNQAHEKVGKIGQYFSDNGVLGKLPLYLVLLQGTDWQLNEKSVFVLPNRDHIDNMVRTVKYVEQHIVPVIGDLVPVSGERTEEYNAISGGASRSKHLNFCAMDMVPEKSWNRAELHQKLVEIHNQTGKHNNVGLGLYSGLRFHIDTCGFRRW